MCICELDFLVCTEITAFMCVRKTTDTERDNFVKEKASVTNMSVSVSFVFMNESVLTILAHSD